MTALLKRHRAPLSSPNCEAPAPEQAADQTLPNAADLGGIGIGECFKQFWTTEPKVRECRLLLCRRCPAIAPLFDAQYLYVRSGRGICDQRWPVALDAGRLIELVRFCLPPEPPRINALLFPATEYGAPKIGTLTWSLLVEKSVEAEKRFNSQRPLDDFLIQAAHALAAQNSMFFAQLRGSQPKRIAFGTTADRLVEPIDSEQWDRRGMWIGIEDDSVGFDDRVLCGWSGVKLRCGEQVREAGTIDRAADFRPGRLDVAPAAAG